LADNLETMLSVDAALDRVLAAFTRLPAERISIRDGLGRVLAEPVSAQHDLPPFANSSMDGYAVRAADVASAAEGAPVTLAVVGDIPAGGMPAFMVGAGQAARIMTGAPMPDGADAVVPVERTAGGAHSGRLIGAAPDRIAIVKGTPPGSYVRLPGEDVKTGQEVLAAGRVLRAADLGVLAGLGVPIIPVIRRPRVAIISTGDELLNADQPLTSGKIRDTNGYTLYALVQELGAQPAFLGIARDTADDFNDRLSMARRWEADLILSSAGVSVGAYDMVKSVVGAAGALNFWKVNLRPGKPLAFGHVFQIPFVGLPGNPVSAMVTFDVFVRPAILKMMGKPPTTHLVEAETGEPIVSDGRQSYLRVTLTRQGERLIAHTTGNQSSGVLTSLVNADGLLIVPAGTTNVPAGTRLSVRVYGY